MADDLPPLQCRNVKKIWGLNLPGTPWATSACCGRPLLYFHNVGTSSTDKSNKLTIMRSGTWESHQLRSSLKSLSYSNRHAINDFTFPCFNCVYVQYFMHRLTADDAVINFLSVDKSIISRSGTVSHPLHRTLAANLMDVLQIKSCHVKLNQSYI